MLLGCVIAQRLLLHVVDLQRQDAESVDSPCRTLGIEPCIGLDDDVAVFLAEIGINLLYEVSAVLVGTVDAPFQLQGVYRIDVWIADDILEMPLNSVYPAFQIEPVLNGIAFVGVVDRRFDIIFDVIIDNSLIENLIA